MKILHLTLKKMWFDLIKSGVKTEEYREIKPYWAMRLCNKTMFDIHDGKVIIYRSLIIKTLKHFDTIRFTNGYGKNAPSFDIECLGISIGQGNSELGAPNEQVFIISLGKILPKQ